MKKKLSKGASKLLAGLNDALEHARGENNMLTIREVIVDAPQPQDRASVVDTRRRLQLSQKAFARTMNVSVQLVQAWETGVRKPQSAALRLLEIVRRHPEIVRDEILVVTKGENGGRRTARKSRRAG